jgi:hypothetical protein
MSWTCSTYEIYLFFTALRKRGNLQYAIMDLKNRVKFSGADSTGSRQRPVVCCW